ncbi:hypothetical protein [Actinomadura sp. 9N407]|uniref:hypothetical protein n=1 Tax=Actinomadura sp. 9N407 TaxID=3375154 RepID=UPI0037BC0F5E
MAGYVRRVAAVALGVALTAGGVTGCGRTQGSQADVKRDSGQDLDLYRPGDIAVYNKFRMPGALLSRPPKDLADGVQKSTAVVVAEVTGVRQTRVVGPPEGRLPMAAVVLRTIEVLEGEVRPELKEVVVELLPHRP